MYMFMNWYRIQRIFLLQICLTLATILLTNWSMLAQSYPYPLNQLNYSKDTLIEQIFIDSDLEHDPEIIQVMLDDLDSLLALENLSNKQKAICLSISGSLLIDKKERDEAFLFYKQALPLVEDISEDDLVYSVVHGSYGMYMAYYQVHDGILV